jgi:hypothetical protein
MANRKNSNPGKESKKKFRIDIEERLALVLMEVKDALGEKKFKRRIKKAGKLLTKGIQRKAIDHVQKKLPATYEQPAAPEVPSSTIEDLP